MSATPTTQNSRFDTIKWIFVLALVAAGVVGNSIYSDQSLLYRTLALVALAAVALFVALQTAKGRGYAVSFREARKEIRKVVWPNRQETTQTTLDSRGCRVDYGSGFVGSGLIIELGCFVFNWLVSLKSLVRKLSWQSVGTWFTHTQVTRSKLCAPCMSASSVLKCKMCLVMF